MYFVSSRSLNSSRESEFGDSGHCRISTSDVSNSAADRPLLKMRQCANDPLRSFRLRRSRRSGKGRGKGSAAGGQCPIRSKGLGLAVLACRERRLFADPSRTTDGSSRPILFARTSPASQAALVGADQLKAAWQLSGDGCACDGRRRNRLRLCKRPCSATMMCAGHDISRPRAVARGNRLSSRDANDDPIGGRRGNNTARTRCPALAAFS